MMIAGSPGLFKLTLGEFIQRVQQDYGVTYENTPPHRHLVKRVAGRKKIAYIQPHLLESDYLVSDVLRSLCAQLEIPIADFSFYV